MTYKERASYDALLAACFVLAGEQAESLAETFLDDAHERLGPPPEQPKIINMNVAVRVGHGANTEFLRFEVGK